MPSLGLRSITLETGAKSSVVDRIYSSKEVFFHGDYVSLLSLRRHYQGSLSDSVGPLAPR